MRTGKWGRGDGHGGVHHHNGLLNVNGIFEGRFKLVLTNPPFGSNVTEDNKVLSSDYIVSSEARSRYRAEYGEAYDKAIARTEAAEDKPILSMFKLPRSEKMKTELLFIERCLDLLQSGGKLGIVLPEGVFNNPSQAYVREFVEDRAHLATYAEEATEMVKPFQQPEHEWPVYGVNNKEGVFFSHKQLGEEFNAPYKRIRTGWFFHNPTRSSVGSLGHVPEVPEDAITSPEYQVWKLRDLSKNSLLPDFVAVLIRTKWFVRIVQFHRVGAVKQRLYVENLLEMPVPKFPHDLQERIATARAIALVKLADARKRAEVVKREVEEMILGVRPVPNQIKVKV